MDPVTKASSGTNGNDERAGVGSLFSMIASAFSNSMTDDVQIG